MFKASTVTLREAFGREQGEWMGRELCEQLGGVPAACWLFCSPKESFEDLVAGVCDMVGTDMLIGCTTDGEISADGVSVKSAVLTGIATDRIEFEMVSVKNAGKDSAEAGKKLARKFSEPIDYLQLFTDGLTVNGCDILRGVQSVLGKSIPIAGGTAGDDGQFLRTWQFAGPEVLTDAAVAIGMRGDFKVGQGVRSGWEPIGLAKRVTRAKGNVLYELNNEPALKVYERFLGKHADRLPSVGVEYPLGLIDHCWPLDDGNYYLLRATMTVNRDDGSISFAGDVPEGAMVRLTCADSASVLQAAGKAAKTALDQLEGTAPVMAFAYSCMARKTVLGRKVAEEMASVRRNIGTNVPTAGFFTYGEFGSVRPGGTCVLHNETITVTLLGL